MKLIGTEEAERVFSISRSWFYHRRGGEGMPLHKRGKYLMLDPDEFMAWLRRECLVAPRSLRGRENA